MNWVDYVLLGIVGLSTLVGLLRGCVREVLTIGAWVGAALLTAIFSPYARLVLRDAISFTLAADLLAYAGTYLVLLVVLTFICHRLASAVQASALSGVDRVLGISFGLGRGLLVAGLVQYGLGWIYREDATPPAFIAESKTWPSFDAWTSLAAAWVLPAEGSDGEAEPSGDSRSSLTDAMERPQPAEPNGAGGDTGYRDTQRQDMDRLLDAAE